MSAGDANGARDALAGASMGTCVVLAGGSYSGSFDVPPGVALVAQNGARATVTGGTAQNAAVSLGEGAQLVGIDVIDTAGVGIAVRAAKAALNGVTVTGSKNAALAILCKGATCAPGAVTLTDVRLEKSSLGLWVSGAHVVMTRGSSANHAGTSLSSAAGMILQDGAQIELDGVLVEKNQGVGILIDGAQTKASIKNSTINENGERGLWAQRLAGTNEAPALRLEECTITKNKIVGVGALESHGIIIVGGRVAETIASPLVTNLTSTEQIGDGIGLFNSGDFKLDGTTVEANERAAGITDGSDRGIIIVGGKVAAGASGLKFVVQNTKGADVQIADTDRSATEKPLGVSTPTLVLPPVL
jgi:Right handed beta helix region